ncbi:YadA-like family protein [Avibacterium paragallinarum]|uniref:YadA-like family protein n=1 Tax=Avibacterium paragallinarum TaxID=728 RepID=UPI0021F6B8D4|nr:YadA-like family protein [Avibacterium paragallinarum]UXN35936.1 YadA-like family protein [Avibacterium paragallinarum]
MLIKVKKIPALFLTLFTLLISYNTLAKDEAPDCAPCERLDLIDAILGVNTWAAVTNDKDDFERSDFYNNVVFNYIPNDEDNDPEIAAEMKNYIKNNTIIGKLENDIDTHDARITQLENRKLIPNLNTQITQLQRDIKLLDNRLASGIAASNAMAGLVSATKDGKSMVAVGVGTYRDRSAVAIGVSRLSADESPNDFGKNH